MVVFNSLSNLEPKVGEESCGQCACRALFVSFKPIYRFAMIWKMNAESLANKTDLRRSLFVDYYKAMRREGWLLLLDEDRPVAIGLLGLGEYLVSL